MSSATDEMSRQKPGSFVLTDEEKFYIGEAQKLCIEHGADFTGEMLEEIIDRACRTLGPQPVQGGETAAALFAEIRECLGKGLIGFALKRLGELESAKPIAQSGDTSAEDVLRDIACYVSAGGYNAPTVDPEMFRRKIRDGIDHEVDFWRKRAETAELKLTLELNVKPVAQELTAVRAVVDEWCATRVHGSRMNGCYYMNLVADALATKPALSEPADPVRALLAEMREDAPDSGRGTKYWGARLERALAARDAQKAGGR